jgi:hypothetical protein
VPPVVMHSSCICGEGSLSARSRTA